MKFSKITAICSLFLLGLVSMAFGRSIHSTGDNHHRRSRRHSHCVKEKMLLKHFSKSMSSLVERHFPVTINDEKTDLYDYRPMSETDCCLIVRRAAEAQCIAISHHRRAESASERMFFFLSGIKNTAQLMSSDVTEEVRGKQKKSDVMRHRQQLLRETRESMRDMKRRCGGEIKYDANMHISAYTSYLERLFKDCHKCKAVQTCS